MPIAATRLPLLTACLGSAAFLAAGLHVLLCLPVLVLFAGAAAVDLVRAPAAATGRRRWVLALALGAAVAWLGVADHQEHGPTAPQAWLEWQQAHGVGDDHFETRVVSGFPLQWVEGHGGGGAREHLPPGKGLWALLGNFWLLTAAASVLAAALDRRVVGPAAWAALVALLWSGGRGVWALLWMLD